MSVQIRADRLRWECARRGWGSTDLARNAGISRPTASAMFAGRPAAPRTVRLIARALLATPPLDVLDELVPQPDRTPPSRAA